MTMIFRLIFSFLFLVMSANFANAKEVTVQVTGYGSDYKTAVSEGLKEAVAQVTGVSINSQELLALSTTVNAEDNDVTSTFNQQLTKEQQSQLSSKINGYVSSYQVLQNGVDDTGTYFVDMSVNIEKYEIAGLNSNRRSIAVLGFKANTKSCFGLPLSGEKQANYLTEALNASLTSLRKFSVLDRDSQNVYELEKALAYTEDVKGIETAKLGNVKLADYILTGSVSSVNIVATSRHIDMTNEDIISKRASAVVEFKLLLFASREIKLSSSVSVSLSNQELNKPISGEQAFSILMKKASTIIAQKIMEAIYPALVIQIKEDMLYINQGGDNIKKGDIFDIFATGEKIIDPYTGESLGAEETNIALMEIVEIKPKFSLGKLIKGNIKDITVGDICRINREYKKPQKVINTRNAPKKIDTGVKLPFD